MLCPQEGREPYLWVGRRLEVSRMGGQWEMKPWPCWVGRLTQYDGAAGAPSCKRATTSAAAPAADIANQSQNSCLPSRDVTSASPSNSPGSHYQLIGTGP